MPTPGSRISTRHCGAPRRRADPPSNRRPGPGGGCAPGAGRPSGGHSGEDRRVGPAVPGSERRTRYRVLVVDDESAMRALCRVNLQLAGMDVLEAADGDEALALAEAGQPDIVLLDVMMPSSDGWQVARELARRAATRDIPLVFLTARAEQHDRRRGYELGAVGYILKPFDPVGIADLLERTLERLRRGEREALRAEILEGS